jgi:anti-anti-sigma factor
MEPEILKVRNNGRVFMVERLARKRTPEERSQKGKLHDPTVFSAYFPGTGLDTLMLSQWQTTRSKNAGFFEGGFVMLSHPMNPAPYTVVCTLPELVRGCEQRWLDEVLPLASRHSIELDLHGVVRIDAAGIAALIQIYKAAQQAGYSFHIVNASRHVKETLHIVGLDRLCESHNAVN